jgi:hypothetical protein
LEYIVILKSNGSLGMMGGGKPPNALRAKGLEKEEEEVSVRAFVT